MPGNVIQLSGCLLAIMLSSVLTEVAVMRRCEDGQDHTTSGCCKPCPPGSGVKDTCTTAKDTTCESCSDGRTYSDSSSHEDLCQTCTRCDENASEISPCTATNDTVCECKTGYFMDKYEKKCRLCDLCPEGFEVAKRCALAQNTRCKRCPDGTFSDRRSNKGCRYCTVCRPDQLTLNACNYREDTVCVEIPVPITESHDPEQTETMIQDNGTSHGDIIPVYCSLLGALVVGLIIYVIVAHRRRVAANKQNKRLGIQDGASPNSKQGSDSGVFVEQEQKHALLAKRIADLSPSTLRVVEGMLMSHDFPAADWRHLATKLGYNVQQAANIEVRGRQEGTTAAHCLLEDWGRTDNATCGELVKALRQIARDDIARILQPETRDHRNRDVIEPLVV